MDLAKAIRTVVQECLGVKKGEEVLIVVDEKSKDIGRAFQIECMRVGAEVTIAEMIERNLDGEEPPRCVAAAMKEAQVVLAPTSKSLSHTRARHEATAAGVRIASMPGITEEMMIRTLSCDYGKIAEITIRYAEVLTKGSRAKVLSTKGTNIEMSIEGRGGVADTGILNEAGGFGNLPAGEAYIAPVEGTANGKVVFDGAIAGIGELDQPVTVVVENGAIKEILGGKAAREFSKMIEDANDPRAKNLAELGIGTNENATLSGSLLEVEKVFGTVHIAFGDNKSFGGCVEAPLHVDGVILNPTLLIDGKPVLERGKMLL